MGHFHTTVQARGRNREEAEVVAVHEFLFEHGHRHDIREIESAVLIRKAPPIRVVERPRQPGEHAKWGGPYVRFTPTTVFEEMEDPTAPADQWEEVWEFVIHSHA